MSHSYSPSQAPQNNQVLVLRAGVVRRGLGEREAVVGPCDQSPGQGPRLQQGVSTADLGLPQLSKASARGPETRPLVYHIRNLQKKPPLQPGEHAGPLQESGKIPGRVGIHPKQTAPPIPTSVGI